MNWPFILEIWMFHLEFFSLFICFSEKKKNTWSSVPNRSADIIEYSLSRCTCSYLLWLITVWTLHALPILKLKLWFNIILRICYKCGLMACASLHIPPPQFRARKMRTCVKTMNIEASFMFLQLSKQTLFFHELSWALIFKSGPK